MSRHPLHPTDDTLLLAIDRELASARRMTLDRHLTECERCRARLRSIASMAVESADLYRDEMVPPIGDTEALRERLRASMAGLATAWQRSWWVRLRHGIATVPVIARVAARSH